VQLEALGRALCERVGVEVPAEGAFGGLRGLCAGDFAAVARQAATMPSPSLLKVQAMLAEECRLKRGSGKGIGFT
jgi:hypothetical protein